MLNLSPVTFNNEAALRAIIPRKQAARRDRLTAALNHILGRYTEYAANTEELSAINASIIAGLLVEDCKSLYLTETDEKSALRRAIFASQPAIARSLCQYGSIGEPDELDHYAAKGRFPEFSLFSLNLIPCCGTCNLDKGAGWTEKGYRHFINFCHDEFIQRPLLHAELYFETNGEMGVKFSLRNHPDVTETQFSIIASHFAELRLFERHAERAVGVIAETRNMIRRLNVRVGVVEDMLQAAADSKLDEFGVNYWQAALYRCLATSGRFVEECLGNDWLPRASAEVAHLLASPISAATSGGLRMLVRTRAWRLYMIRGLTDGHDVDDWFQARAELGLPPDRFV